MTNAIYRGLVQSTRVVEEENRDKLVVRAINVATLESKF